MQFRLKGSADRSALAQCAGLLFLACLPALSTAAAPPPFIGTDAVPGAFPLADSPGPAPIWVDPSDSPGVHHAARSLRSDLESVCGRAPVLLDAAHPSGSNVVIIGTLGRSPLLDNWAAAGKINTNEVQGRWESFLLQVVRDPEPGIASALVIAGSDKRGTIYGVYEVSEQSGVSPWYWWADVPVPHRDRLFAGPGRFVQGPPAVRYRGIFLNDEAPSLTGWVTSRYGNYNHSFYTNVFELLLRLRANCLWPAMWNNCFNQDDPLNPKLADEYGIVMGTSHVEPMMRADKEWNRLGHTAADWNYDTHAAELRAFWKDGLEAVRPYENLITIAMRGKIDTPMSESANIALLERIVADQRGLIASVWQTNPAAVPQVWALYKEVQEYYEKGMRVPDDVTLLWCDDNWGNLRRLPTAAEAQRSGGAGVYYHLDYVGGPRNYKWLNTVPIPRIWEQMNQAWVHHADRIWILNVGDLKPMELPMSFFLAFARDPGRWSRERFPGFTRDWAAQQFGPENAAEIAWLLDGYTRLNGRRKPELLSPDTYSLVNYNEADRVLAEWRDLSARAGQLLARIPPGSRDAFWQLVYYPVQACAVVNELYITAARNRLYSRQGRASANDLAGRARALFQQDRALSDFYNHSVSGGKWNHMMDQVHLGYTSWQQPASNSLPALVEITTPAAASMAVAVEGSAAAWPGATNSPALPPFDVYNQQERWIDVFNRGQAPFRFSAAAGAPWILLSTNHGTVRREERLRVRIDWPHAPVGRTSGDITIAAPGQQPVTLSLDVFNPAAPRPASVRGFVESGGCIAIEAAHYTRRTSAGGAGWEEIPGYGRTLSAMTPVPADAPSLLPPAAAPCLEYRVYVFNPGKAEVIADLAPLLNYAPGRGLRFAVSFDDDPPRVVTAVPEGFAVENGNRAWEKPVEDAVRRVSTPFTLSRSGYHTLKFWMVDPGLVLERLVIDLGGLQPSYLGPPESFSPHSQP